MEKILSSKIVYTCPIFQIEEAEVELPDGTQAQRWYILRRDAVFIIGIREGKIILIREHRSASDTIEWRVPAGEIHEGEDPRKAAIREYREEVGLEPLDIELIKSIKVPSGSVKQTLHFYKATQFRENPLNTGDKGEELIEKHELSTDEVKKILDTHELPEYSSRFVRKVLDELGNVK